MKGCERYLNAINELVDGTLGPIRRAELELHLEGCEDCRALLADLRRVTEAAGALPALEPPDRVWTQIAGTLRAEGRVAPDAPPPPRRNYTMLALAATLLLAVGSSLWLLLARGGPDAGAPASAGAGEAPAAAPAATPVAIDPDRVPAPSLEPMQTVASELARSEEHFQRAVERATQGDAAFDAETAAVLQKNMLVVNQAIAESRKVLEADPQNPTVRQSLYEALRQKIQFLQDTIVLMNEMRQGDAAGAAEIVEGKS